MTAAETRSQVGRRPTYNESALIPKERYTSKEWLAAEYEKLWPRVWQMACRLEEIPQVGDFYEYQIGKRSILVVRSAPDTVKAFYNHCLHRGTRLCAGVGNVGGDEIICRFHGWSYDLVDGSVRDVPDAEDFAPECVARDKLHLSEVHVGTWGGFVFINMAKDPVPLLEFLAPVVKGLAPFELDKMRYLRYRTTIVDCNWKAGVDAFNESYHVYVSHGWDLSGMRALIQSGDPNPASHSNEVFREGIYDARDAEGRTPPSTEFRYEVFEFGHSMLRQTPNMARDKLRLDPDLATTAADYESREKLADFGDAAREIVLQTIEGSRNIAMAHQDDIDYVRNLPELPGDMSILEFQVHVRREVGKAGGIDYSHIPDADMLSSIDYCMFPNLLGPGNAGNFLMFRFRPNGDDPDTCILDVLFLHRFPEGQEPPQVQHEFYPNWRDHDDWGYILLEDFSNLGHVQAGMHQDTFEGLRLGRQEVGLRNHQKFLERYVHS